MGGHLLPYGGVQVMGGHLLTEEGGLARGGLLLAKGGGPVRGGHLFPQGVGPVRGDHLLPDGGGPASGVQQLGRQFDQQSAIHFPSRLLPVPGQFFSCQPCQYKCIQKSAYPGNEEIRYSQNPSRNIFLLHSQFCASDMCPFALVDIEKAIVSSVVF